MAEHIRSVKGSTIPAVNKDAFWAALREGYLIFCSGDAAISHAIEDACRSPWSHVVRVIRAYQQWCVLEAVYPHGVSIAPMWQYIDRYNGDLVLCKRVIGGADSDESPAILKGIELLGRPYAVAGLLKEELHRICRELPPEMNGTSCYCSGLQWVMSQATAQPFPASPKGGAPTPEDLYTDRSIVAVCALVRESAMAAGAS